MVIDGITIVLWVISVYFAFSIYCNIRGKHYKFISKDVSLNTTLFFFLGYKAFFEVNDAWVMVLVTLCIIVGIMYFYRNSFVDYSKMKKDFLGLALSIALVFVIKSFIIDNSYIPSSSMRPAIAANTITVINRFGQVEIPVIHRKLIGRQKINRNDIIIFRQSLLNEVLIKRVIGLPSDVLIYDNKKNVYINGQKINLQKLNPKYLYIDEDSKEKLALTEYLTSNGYNIIVNESQSWLLLDYYINSDCQLFETYLQCKIPANKYFVMGDNRDNSFDSRYFGFVSKDQIVGKKLAIDIHLPSNGLNFFQIN